MGRKKKIIQIRRKKEIIEKVKTFKETKNEQKFKKKIDKD